MKRIVLPTLLILLFTGISLAQIQLAPIVGMNISKIKTTNNLETGNTYTNLHGLIAGMNAKYTLGDRFNVQLEGSFSQKGTEHRFDYVPTRVRQALNYLDFSLLGEYDINEIIALNAGAWYGHQIGEIINNTQAKSALELGSSNHDFGINGGLKFYIGDFFVRTSYLIGLNTLGGIILTDENGVQTGLSEAYQQAFQVALGYYLF